MQKSLTQSERRLSEKFAKERLELKALEEDVNRQKSQIYSKQENKKRHYKQQNSSFVVKTTFQCD